MLFRVFSAEDNVLQVSMIKDFREMQAYLRHRLGYTGTVYTQYMEVGSYRQVAHNIAVIRVS